VTSIKIDEVVLNEIYADVARAVTLGDEGIRSHRDGNDASASSALTQARELLTAAAGRCVAAPGCEIERVLLAQDALLDRHAKELLGAGSDAEPVEAGAAPEAATSTVAQAIPETARAVALLKGRDLRTLVTLNEPVKAALEEWLTWLRPNLLEAYENYQYMRYKMAPAYERAGLPEAILFGMLAKESGGKVHAVSRAGASGPLQFMHYTGLRYGLGRVDGFDTRFDPAESSRANGAYLNDQLRVFNNNLELTLGAYNGGEGRVARLSKNGARGFWDPQVYNNLPPETRDYVPMVLAAAWLFLHPEEYNLQWPKVDARPGGVVLAQAMSLNELSICLGQRGNERGWFRTLRNLNPRHDATARLPAGTRLEMPASAAAAYAASCTGGPMLALSKQLFEARPPTPAGGGRGAGGGRTHIVRRGESLSSIARKFGCHDVKSIATANRIKPPHYAIRAGQRLVVPSCRV
jgi:membrane-bound lytic murein transglycosylase D